jgi:hypothetical protein
VNDIAKAISQLERQRATIDHAIAALREVEALTPTAHASSPGPSKPGKKTAAKRRMSAEGRKRISEAAKKRWAEKRAAEAAPPAKTGPSTRKTARRGRAKKASSTASA